MEYLCLEIRHILFPKPQKPFGHIYHFFLRKKKWHLAATWRERHSWKGQKTQTFSTAQNLLLFAYLWMNHSNPCVFSAFPLCILSSHDSWMFINSHCFKSQDVHTLNLWWNFEISPTDETRLFKALSTWLAFGDLVLELFSSKVFALLLKCWCDISVVQERELCKKMILPWSHQWNNTSWMHFRLPCLIEGEGTIPTKILTVLNKWVVTHSYGGWGVLPNGKSEDLNSQGKKCCRPNAWNLRGGGEWLKGRESHPVCFTFIAPFY